MLPPGVGTGAAQGMEDPMALDAKAFTAFARTAHDRIADTPISYWVGAGRKG
jgi:hypothetical protein